MSFDAFLQTAWNDHADRPQEVADRLAASLAIIATAEQIPPIARLATHVFGEHLGQWSRGAAVLESLRTIPAIDSARRCIAVCVDNIAPAFERFFGYAALGLAQRASGDAAGFEALCAQARRQFEAVTPDEAPWCKSALEELGD